MNTLTAAELKRRGMAAIEEGLRRGPIHIVKRNRPTAVVLSEDEYARLAQDKAVAPTGMTALQWLLSHPSTKARKKADIDTALRRERDGWRRA
jgi:prevent-host-death family protein